MALSPGSRLDAYEIICPLGSGGMGEVWLATEVRLGRKVALKVLPAEVTRDPLRVQRFEQEARAASALNHPNVCTILALGETADRQHYIAMEYIEGETLRHRLSTGQLSIRKSLDIAIQVAAALSAAHTAGIVHRDIKPENVMLRPDGFVKVLDFGLAKLAPTAPVTGAADVTHTALKTDAGIVVGTVAYMSPEQARGQEVDARTDIWSLGVVLYEMVVGRSPFAGASGTDVLVSILDREPPPLVRYEPDAPPELQRISTKTVRKDRGRRYQTVQDLMVDLEALREEMAAQVRSSHADGHPAESAPTSAPLPVSASNTLATPSSRTSGVAPVKRHKLLFVFAAMTLLAGVVGGVWWLASRHPSSNQLPSRELQLTQLTANPEDRAVSSAQISPDGKYLAYADPTGIQVRFTDTGDTQRIPETRGMGVYAWSADGSKISAAACDTATCVAWDLALVGGGRRRSGAVWSAGDWIVASVDGSRLVKISTTSTEARMELLDASGPQLLFRQAADTVDSFVDAGWSVDGRHVLFTRRNTPSVIEAIDVTGGSPKALFRATDGLEIQNLGLQLADGRLITALRKDDAAALWEIPAPIGVGRAVGVPRRLTEWKPRVRVWDLSASADGRKIAFLEGTWHSDVYIAAFDHRAGRLLDTPRRLTTDERGNVVRDWTPDGRAVLFESYRNGNADIFEQDITTESPEPLVVRPGDQGGAHVTNDGRWILFRDVEPRSGGAPAPVRIMRVPASGGVPQQVFASTSGASLFFDCSAHGRCVLLEEQSNQMVVSSLDAVRGKGARLATLPFSGWGDALLPDGDHLAVIVDGFPRNRLRIVSFRGEPPREIVVEKAVALSGLRATPDGSGFFSRNGSGLRTDLLLIRPDGTSLVLLARQGSFRPRAAVASPDATHLAIEAMTAKIDVWMLQEN